MVEKILEENQRKIEEAQKKLVSFRSYGNNFKTFLLYAYSKTFWADFIWQVLGTKNQDFFARERSS